MYIFFVYSFYFIIKIGLYKVFNIYFKQLGYFYKLSH